MTVDSHRSFSQVSGKLLLSQSRREEGMSASGAEPTGRKGRTGSALPSSSDVDLFRDRDSVIDLNSEVPDGALDLGMAQQELDRSQVACPSIDQGCLSS